MTRALTSTLPIATAVPAKRWVAALVGTVCLGLLIPRGAQSLAMVLEDGRPALAGMMGTAPEPPREAAPVAFRLLAQSAREGAADGVLKPEEAVTSAARQLERAILLRDHPSATAALTRLEIAAAEIDTRRGRRARRARQVAALAALCREQLNSVR